ncbi:hypothetical protein FRC98_04395 [Lujinxingia vulgaris]|uniref:Phosphatidylglycerol--prolipoprotein diacylglyceryl transferase n=1 Tax=Lujinxingia vulgaris TaxID=2600176 RepID=A0A5C6XLD2_9DELT|nr:prolipoprotein diacylglyceryl transferase family protein [Lujinxingia vulgaris]TXD38144.1 hypothetical protein FRC98_04395 [Lujinxingia vulgaris]
MNLLGVLPYWQLGPWELGPLTLHSFGLSVAIGVALALSILGSRGQKILGVSGDRMQNFGMWLLIFGWCFSHVFEVVAYQPHIILEDPLVLFKVWGSISSVGGLIGGVIAFLIWRVRNPYEDHIGWSNVAAFTLPIAFFFGRIGCALVHDHPGADATDFIVWEWIRSIFGDSLPEIWPLALQYPDGVPRHDLGFYEAIVFFFLTLFVLYKGRKPQRRGYYLWTLPLLYAPFRFLFDFLRVTPGEAGLHGDTRYLMLTPAQWVAIGMLILGLFLWSKLRNEPVETWKGLETPPSDKDQSASSSK